MAFNLQFNAATVQPNVAPEPLPSGIYDVMIVETDEELVKDGNGQSYFKVTMQVVNGEFTGRKIIDRLNTKHENPETARIAWGTFSAICYVTGVMVIQQSSAELHGKHFKVKIHKGVMRVKDDKGKYINHPEGKESNEIRGYLDSMGYEPGKNPGVAAAVGSGFGGQPAASGFGAPQTTQAPAGFGGQPQQTTTAPPPSFAAPQTQQQQPPQTQAPAFVQQQQPQQQQPQTQAAPPPSFAAPQTQSAPPPSFAQQQQPQPESPPPSFAQPQQQQVQQIDPAANAGSPVPSWATAS